MLAIQRADNGSWEPPGGVLEVPETLEAGVRREVFEATGVHVKVERAQADRLDRLDHGIRPQLIAARADRAAHHLAP